MNFENSQKVKDLQEKIISYKECLAKKVESARKNIDS